MNAEFSASGHKPQELATHTWGALLVSGADKVKLPTVLFLLYSRFVFLWFPPVSQWVELDKICEPVHKEQFF